MFYRIVFYFYVSHLKSHTRGSHGKGYASKELEALNCGPEEYSCYATYERNHRMDEQTHKPSNQREQHTHMKCYNSPCSDMFTRGVVVMETITLRTRTRTTMTTAAIDVSRLEIRGPSLTHSSHWHGVWLSQVVTSCLWRLLCAHTHKQARGDGGGSGDCDCNTNTVVITIHKLPPPACHLPTIMGRVTNDHGFPDICVQSVAIAN